ncbi:MAG: hypothetical protein HRT45_14950 [Bdellovibrionales bacterium]|nr:hypothetical protein [Bdellovibrionales bacterium]
MLLTACSQPEVIDTTGNRISPTFNGPPEQDYCDDVQSYGDAVAISGTGAFEYRAYTGSGLGAVESTPKPIRHAEVRILQGSNIVQCGETDASGNFSLNIPRDTGSYTLQINSRANNSFARVSVLNGPEKNQFYSIETTVSSSSSRNIGTMIAPATGSVIAGAYNILDQIVDANAYLRNNVGPGDCASNGCTEVSVAPKVAAYWQAGFNPGEYLNGSPLSYYIRGFRRLFILGGLNGDTDFTDTDHFDNTIILHEYGHFLEDVYFGTDTPGGPHNGNSIIDPRLAWSEAWSNLFQGVVRGVGSYLDTEGNVDGDTDYLVFITFESNSSLVNDFPQFGVDNGKGYGQRGEGNFREYSITRLLWDSVDSNTDGESVTNGFEEMWTSLSNTTFGWNNSRWKFRSMGTLHKIHNDRSGVEDWTTLQTIEKHAPDRGEYAQYIEPDAGCADADFYVTLTPGGPGSGSPSVDYFRDHDFYHLRGPASGTLTVEFQDTDSLGTEADLDIYVYDENARLFNSDDRRASTTATNNTPTVPGDLEVDSVRLNLGSGDYLIDVFSFTGLGTRVRYGLKLNGTRLCLKDPP